MTEIKGNGANLGFENQMWAAADKLRANSDLKASEYTHLQPFSNRVGAGAFQRTCFAAGYLNHAYPAGAIGFKRITGAQGRDINTVLAGRLKYGLSCTGFYFLAINRQIHHNAYIPVRLLFLHIS